MSLPVIINPLTVLDDGYGQTVGITSGGRLKVDVAITSGGCCDGAELDALEEQVTNIQVSLDGYATTSDLDAYCPVDRCEEIADQVTNIQNVLDGYDMQADLGELEEQVTNVQNALDGYCTQDTCDDILAALDGYDGYNIFGTSMVYAESEGESFLASTIYNEKVSFTTESLTAGSYYIGWSAEIKAPNGNSKDIDVKIELDDTIIVAKIRSEEDSDFTSSSGIRVLSIDTGVHTIDMDWRRNGPSGSAGIRRARIVLWRVS